MFELHLLPHRVIARLEHIAVTFSWIGGRAGTVADGQLLVIEWRGVSTETRGISALQSAVPYREQVYRAEGSDPEHWRWRMDDINGRAYSTAHLAAEWVAGAVIELAD